MADFKVNFWQWAKKKIIPPNVGNCLTRFFGGKCGFQGQGFGDGSPFPSIIVVKNHFPDLVDLVVNDAVWSVAEILPVLPFWFICLDSTLQFLKSMQDIFYGNGWKRKSGRTTWTSRDGNFVLKIWNSFENFTKIVQWLPTQDSIRSK